MHLRLFGIASLMLLCGCRFIPGTQAHDIHEAHERMALRLRDPDAAQYRGDRVIQSGADRFVCGEVNGRNGAGGYEGFAPYVYAVGSRRVEILSSLSDPTPSKVREVCVETYVEMARASGA